MLLVVGAAIYTFADAATQKIAGRAARLGRYHTKYVRYIQYLRRVCTP